MAPTTTTTTTMPAEPLDNSTESGGAREGKGDLFATLKDRFFNEMVKLPREYRSVCSLGARVGGYTMGV